MRIIRMHDACIGTVLWSRVKKYQVHFLAASDIIYEVQRSTKCVVFYPSRLKCSHAASTFLNEKKNEKKTTILIILFLPSGGENFGIFHQWVESLVTMAGAGVMQSREWGTLNWGQNNFTCAAPSEQK